MNKTAETIITFIAATALVFLLTRNSAGTPEQTEDQTVAPQEITQSAYCQACSNPMRYTSEDRTIIPTDQRHMKVFYMDGVEDELRDMIEWRFEAFEEFTGITFTTTTEQDDSQIRVSADPSTGAWSYVGSTVLRIPKDRATMNIGFVDQRKIIHPKTRKLIDTYRVIDHEILHTLGLGHEMLNTNTKIDWIEEEVYKYFGRAGWSKETIDFNILNKGNKSGEWTESEPDPYSLMMYYFPCSLTRTRTYCEKNNRILSELDSAWVRKFYPREAGGEEEGYRCFTKEEWLSIYNEYK